jgi:hypothetical protein
MIKSYTPTLPTPQGQTLKSLTVLITILGAISWLAFLVNRPAAAVTSSEVSPRVAQSELILSGGLAGVAPMTAMCNAQQVQWHNPDTNLTLTMTRPQTAPAYYNLTGGSLNLDLSVGTAAAARTFQLQEGSLDVRASGMYLTAFLYDDLGAPVYVSGRLSC